jgi:hypothetical protein
MGMNLTTKPVVVFEQGNVSRPEFIRLPKPGQTEPWTGLSRSSLNTLVWPCRENDFRPPVRSCTLRRKGTMKGVRLIDFQSLMDYVNSKVEPTYTQAEPPRQGLSSISENALVEKLPLNDSLRIIISVHVEKEADTATEGAKLSPQRLRDFAG